MPGQIFTAEDHTKFDMELKKYGLDPEASSWIRGAHGLRYPRRLVSDHMKRLYNEAPNETWDFDSVPKNCNVQGFHATEALLAICNQKGCINDSMLEKLISNLKHARK